MQSCADLARVKFEEELNSGRNYNQKVILDHKMNMKKDEKQMKGERDLKLQQKIM